MTNSISAAMKAAGAKTSKATLYVLANTALKNADLRPFQAVAGFVREMSKSPELLIELIGDAHLQMLALEYLRGVAQDMRSPGDRGGGQSHGDTQSDRAPVNSGSDASVRQERHETQLIDADVNSGGNAGRAEKEGQLCSDPQMRNASSPPALVPRITGLSARQSAARTVLDSFKVRDGRAIGDVKWQEIDHLVGANTREAAVLRLVKNEYAGVAKGDMPIRELISATKLQRFIQEAARAQDAT